MKKLQTKLMNELNITDEEITDYTSVEERTSFIGDVQSYSKPQDNKKVTITWVREQLRKNNDKALITDEVKPTLGMKNLIKVAEKLRKYNIYTFFNPESNSDVVIFCSNNSDKLKVEEDENWYVGVWEGEENNFMMLPPTPKKRNLSDYH